MLCTRLRSLSSIKILYWGLQSTIGSCMSQAQVMVQKFVVSNLIDPGFSVNLITLRILWSQAIDVQHLAPEMER